MNNLTLLIHYHKESEERERNLRATSRWLQREFPGIHISVFSDACEVADDLKPLVTIEDDSRVQGIYHRTKAFNELCKLAETDYVGIWDTDVVFDSGQIWKSVEMLSEKGYDFAWPYDQEFRRIMPGPSDIFAANLNAYQLSRSPVSSVARSVGGAILARRSKYIEIGGENENFIGYGAEDLERCYRMNSLGRTTVIAGPLLHLHHPMTALSKEGHAFSEQNQAEWKRMLSIAPAHLMAEIKTWSWYYG